MPVYFLIFISTVIFAIVLACTLKKNNHKVKKTEKDFWERESASNLTRKVSPETLPYIHIPVDTFPIGKYKDSLLQKCESSLLSLKDKKILNLTGKTATDLKLSYGPANLPFLDECDINYTELVKTIADYGSRLHELGFDDECITVLEFGIDILTDISVNYKLLAALYVQRNETDKIVHLKETAGRLDSLMKNSILNALDKASEASSEADSNISHIPG